MPNKKLRFRVHYMGENVNREHYRQRIRPGALGLGATVAEVGDLVKYVIKGFGWEGDTFVVHAKDIS
jgi:hypothetical protein